MTTEARPESYSFSVSGRVARPPAEVYEAIADPDQLSRYFTTAGARGRLETGAVVTWEFDDYPGPFPVTVVEADPPRRIVIEWEAFEGTAPGGTTRTTFELEPIDDGARTLVTISEGTWLPTEAGARAAFDNCEGWTSMLHSMRAWIEHGLNLREGFYR